MNSALSESARKVQDALRQFGFEKQVLELSEKTRTAKEAAQALGCGVEEIAKSLIFRTQVSGRPVLVITSGSNRVNEAHLSSLVGEAVEKADAAFVREKTSFAIGGVPPFAPQGGLVFLDEDLRQHDKIWAAAGTPFAVFFLSPDDLSKISGGSWVKIS